MRIPLPVSLTAGALLLVAAIFALMVTGGLAGERHCGVEASWYGRESCTSNPCRTRSGEIFTGNDLTAAMVSPRHIGERWRVSIGKRAVVVRINDTGGFAKYGRGIDMSKAAFARIAPLGQGTAKVCLERLR